LLINFIDWPGTTFIESYFYCSFNYCSVDGTFFSVTGQKKNNVFKKMLKLPGAQYVNTVYNPSAALIQFASDFNANRPGFNNLDPIAERELNTKYFKEDILALQHLVPFDVSDWLT